MATEESFEDSKYFKIFKPDIDMFYEEGRKTDELYNEAHTLLERKLNKGNNGAMFGGSSGDRDIIEMSKSLSTIRQTKLNVIKEASNLKKIVAELNIKDRQQALESDEIRDKQQILAVLDALTSKNGTHRNVVPKSSNDAGLELLNTDNIKLSNIDTEMIERYKKNKK